VGRSKLLLDRINKPRSFVILFILFVIATEFAEKDRLIIAEIIFMIYSLGFTLEKVAAMQEHGIHGQYQCELLWTIADLKFHSLLQGHMGVFLRFGYHVISDR
jgi:hypothetical protein